MLFLKVVFFIIGILLYCLIKDSAIPMDIMVIICFCVSSYYICNTWIKIRGNN